MIGINQQKKAIIKQRLTSSVSIFFTSPYLIMRTVPRAAMPTTTTDHPKINHLKKSDKTSLDYSQLALSMINYPFPSSYSSVSSFVTCLLVVEN